MNSHRPGGSIVAVSSKVSQILQSSGRFVVRYDKGRLYTQWMVSSEFEAALQAQREDKTAFEEQMRSRPPELP
jgi:hypothetical protein